MTRTALAAGLALLLAGCTYRVPLGEAAAAPADDGLTGLWQFSSLGDSSHMELLILPLPRHQYLLTIAADAWSDELPGGGADDSRCDRALRGWGVLQAQYIGYITDLDGARFLNLESVCGDPGFAFARYWLKGDTARFATVDRLGDDRFTTTAAIAAAVRTRLEDPQLYSDTITGHRAARRTIAVTWPVTRP